MKTRAAVNVIERQYHVDAFLLYGGCVTMKQSSASKRYTHKCQFHVYIFDHRRTAEATESTLTDFTLPHTTTC